MNLANKILKEKIDVAIGHCPREFDKKIDTIFFSLSERQFNVISKAFGVKRIVALCQSNMVGKIEFNNYKIEIHYADRRSQYELIATHKDYIKDFEEREKYIDLKFGY